MAIGHSNFDTHREIAHANCHKIPKHGIKHLLSTTIWQACRCSVTSRSVPIINFIDDLITMWKELKTYDTISSYRRNLQQLYVDKLIDLAIPAKVDRNLRDIPPIIINKLGEINARLKRAIPRTKGAMTVYHLKFLENRISTALKPFVE